MPLPAIRIVGARQNNLRGVDVEIPRNRLVAITGVSGSGKSSLAFDTLFREGQRRFLETLSAYARQFLGRMEKPEVESIEGLSPAIAVDQKTKSSSPRSTVGTLTEVFDHLRVLYARAGTAHCPECQLPLQAQTRESIASKVLAEFAGRAVSVLAPVVRDRKGSHRKLIADLARRGFIRGRIDGELVRLEEVGELERYKRHLIEVVVDRLRPDPAEPGRLREALEQALELSGGDVIVVPKSGPEDQGEDSEERAWSTSRTCPGCGAETPPLEPRLFSFNSPHGACPECEGLGVLKRPTEARVVADADKTLREGALSVTRKAGGALLYPAVDFRFLEQVAKAHDFDLDTPWKDLPRKAQRVILYGAGGKRYEDEWKWDGARRQGSVRWKRRFKGVITALALGAKSGRKQVQRFLSVAPCEDCKGTRLRAAARAVRFGGATLEELLPLSALRLRERLAELELDRRELRIGRDLQGEIDRRLAFLVQVGLEYLTLERGADTLSGGEAQRIRLAAQLSSGLQGVLYVLDEPSIGLHALDHARLLGALEELRDGGNTVVVVEHDENTLRSADHLIDVGPGAGSHGGYIVASGTPAEVALADSPTGRFLRGELVMPVPPERRVGNGKAIEVRGARAFNLKGIDVRIPLGTLTVITGVSGSGKSTLLNRIVLPAVLARLEREGPDPAPHDKVLGLKSVGDVVCIDAGAIGRTPRSNPATYTGTLTPIRDLFASLPEARMRGYDKSRFSFNVAGGRCEACGGAGAQLVELQFLAPVTVPCEECGGDRFQQETLEIHYKGKSIFDVLEMTVEEALAFFKDHPKIARPLETMEAVGLSYLTLGQPSTTLSGGEAQRIKLVRHLRKRTREHTLYLLDEPTTGLHPQDVQKLLAALQELVEAGHSVVVIEHNLDVIRTADHLVDLGPGGGEEGGQLMAAGTPEEVARVEASHTGAALRGEIGPQSPRVRARGGAAPVLEASDAIVVRGAHTHNLAGIDVSIPRDALTVITGPSGSGKSSLALDTIHTEGRRRFVESLSTYARQFLGTRDRPPVDFIEGLGPSVAVEAGTARGHPRSTVATTTEIHDHLRVLFARAGVARCPRHDKPLERTDAGALARKLAKTLEGRKGWVVAPIFGPGLEQPRSLKKALGDRLEGWRKQGFLRILVNGAEHRIDGPKEALPALPRKARVDLVVDRLSFGARTRARMADAIEQAEAASGGRVALVIRAPGDVGDAEVERHDASTRGSCTECGFQLERKLEPRHFSFNTHAGACEVCDGLGAVASCDPDKLVTIPERALVDGAIGAKFGRYLTKGKGYYEHLLRAVARVHRIDLERPFDALSSKHQELLLNGTGAQDEYKVKIDKAGATFEVAERFTADWPGLCGHVDAWYAKAEDPDWAALLETVMSFRKCRACLGERLRPEVRAVTVGRKRLPEVAAMCVSDALRWLAGLRLSAARKQAVAPVTAELSSRLGLIERVGLGYLTLDRATQTLSGGEARRVRLSASLGSKLVGVCYVLDEPTVGLHPADVNRLTDALLELRDGGNTVLVVEHDESLMERADCIVDMGPGAGRLGGRAVAVGTPAQIKAHPESLTGAALRGELSLVRAADERGTGTGERIELRGAREHNLRGVDFEFEFGLLTGVCGPSGSGKSTLILDTLVPALGGEPSRGRWRSFKGRRGVVARAVVIDASPIGRTPASVPATYTGLLEPLRELFCRSPEARLRGYGPAHFSFNSPRGRCEACEGRGALKIEMQFLADLWLTCDECEGRRYKPEVLDVRWRGHSIADVLDLSVGDALALFEAQPKLRVILQTLADVGLGYLSLGQSSTTLSGGEAQRVKLASELRRTEGTEGSILILDEPSTGLHASDVRHLARVLWRLARAGGAVVLIEHHTGLLSTCDRLVELGPGGGVDGGRVMASGTPEELARDADSLTGPFLARELERARPSGTRPRRRKVKEVAR